MEQKEEIVPTTSSVVTISTGANLVELSRRAEIIDTIFRKIMKRDVHYGVIPGMSSDKPSLFKAGAEKIAAVFNLGSKLSIEKTLLPDGHREYQVTAHIIHYPTGSLIGDGVGVCSTMEAKYRYRNVADFEVTGEVIPRDYKEQKSAYRKKGFGAKKVDGEWQWVRYGDSERSENPDVADVYNTVIKMAKKRALVDAILTATGASDIFTQDVEDFADLGGKPDPMGDDPKPAKSQEVRKMTVVEGIEIISATIGDVQEKKTANGTLYYTVDLGNGKVAGTTDHDLAHAAAETTGEVKVEVRPGRTPGSLVLLRLIVPEEVEA